MNLRQTMAKRHSLNLFCLALAAASIGCRVRTPSVTSSSTVDAVADTLDLTWQAFDDGLQGAALPTRAKADSKRFERLEVERTGIDFAHNWTPPPAYQLEIYDSLPGGGVCIGDYDDDGLPDVYLTQPHVGARLYRNLGDFRFEDVTESTVGDSPQAQGATFVDVDNDGDLDLYVCNDDAPNQLFVNHGQGRFEEQAGKAGLAFQGASVMMAFADFRPGR